MKYFLSVAWCLELKRANLIAVDAIYTKHTDITQLEANMKSLINKPNWSKQSLQTYMGENYISQNDRHPNEIGNKLIAQALFGELMEKHG